MLNFQDFKKIKEDEKTATMQHNKGHKITIVKSALPAIQREALKRLKLADGGPVEIKMYANADEPISAADDAPTIDQTPAPAPVAETAPSQGVTYTNGTVPSDPVVQEQLAEKQKENIARAAAPVQENIAKTELEQRQLQTAKDAENISELHGHADDYKRYINSNPIDENQFMNNRTTGTKIANTLGLILGGFSPNGNPAQQHLERMIDRNIDAQKHNADNQKSVYGAYLDLYKDDVIASGLAKISAHDEADLKMKHLATQLGTATAEQAYNAASAAHGIENAKTLGVVAKRLGDLKDGRATPAPNPYSKQPPAVGGESAPSQQAPGALNKVSPKIGAPAGIAAAATLSHPASYDVENMHASLQPTGSMTGGYGTPKPEEPEYKVPGNSSMLSPSADKFVAGLKTQPMIPESQKEEIQKEYKQQKNAEAGMKQIDEVFPRLYKNATLTGFAMDKGAEAAHTIGGTAAAIGTGLAALGAKSLIGKGGVAVAKGAAEAVGGAAAAASGVIPLTIAGIAALGAGAAVYMTKDQRIKYDADKVALRSGIAQALKGVPGYEGGAAIEHLVDAVTPTVFDSKEDLDRKALTIKDVIRQHTTSTYLKERGHSNN